MGRIGTGYQKQNRELGTYIELPILILAGIRQVIHFFFRFRQHTREITSFTIKPVAKRVLRRICPLYLIHPTERTFIYIWYFASTEHKRSSSYLHKFIDILYASFVLLIIAYLAGGETNLLSNTTQKLPILFSIKVCTTVQPNFTNQNWL